MPRFRPFARLGLVLSLTAACTNEVAGGDSWGEAGTAGSSESGVDTGTTAVPGTSAGSDSGGVIYDVGTRADLGDAPTGSCADAERVQGAAGCLFWGVDLPNSREGAQGGDAESQQYAIVVANNSAEVEATVRVFVGAGAQAIDEAVVPPEGTHAFELPAASIDPTVSSADGVAYRVESEVPITAYQFNPLENILVYSNDATVLWPDHALTHDYVAVTENATSLAPSFVSVVATVDGTHVQAFPTTELAIVGAPEAVLDRGEVFTVISLLADDEPTNGGNLSGTRVVADQPVAAFSGNVSAPIIPAGAGWVGGSRICCADHMEHQLIPLEAWGRSHVVATPAPAYYPVDPARYRITGAFDDTALVYDPVAPPGAPSSIGAGETLMFETDVSFTVTSGDPQKPFAVTQFLPSGDTTDSLFDDERRGDPAMIMIPAREQFQDKYVFAVPDAYAINRLTIVAEIDATIELDGEAIAAELEPLGVVDGVEYVYAHVDVGVGSHVVTGSAPMGMTVAGYDVEVSYGFAAGGGLAAISTPPPPPG